jgi:hypothetical protein
MRTIILVLFSLATFSISNAQDKDLIGTWNIIEFATISDNNSEKMAEDKLKENGSVWDLFFMEESKFKQTSSMSGTGTMDSQEGVWNTSDKNLTIGLLMNDRKFELIYTYELKENILVLTRSNPMGTWKVVATFKKK